MRKSLFKFLEDVLRDYPELPKYIQAREEELRHPTPERDENVGGGKAENRQARTELDMYITIDEDRRLNQLKKNKEAVENTLDDSGKRTCSLIANLYFTKHPKYSVSGWAHENYLSTTQAYRLRNDFFELLARNMGIYIGNER